MLQTTSLADATATENASATSSFSEYFRSSDSIQLRETVGRGILDMLSRTQTAIPEFGAPGDSYTVELEEDGRVNKVNVIFRNGAVIQPRSLFRNYFSTPCLSECHTLEVRFGKNYQNTSPNGWSFRVVGFSVSGGEMSPFVLASRSNGKEVIMSPLSLFVLPDYDTQDQPVGKHDIIWFDNVSEVPDSLGIVIRQNLRTGELTHCGKVPIDDTCIEKVA